MIFAIVWSYVVQGEAQTDFEQAYGPAGEWVQFFRKGTGYVRTELMHDTKSPNRYATIDYWDSERDYDAFHEQYADEYQALDARFEAWTISESLIGRFEIVSA